MKNAELWKGKFGDAYHERNPETNREPIWRDVLGVPYMINPMQFYGVKSICEVGAGQGFNLNALRWLFNAKVTVGIEVNATACKAMKNAGHNVFNQAFLDVGDIGQFDMVLTRGFLMHVPDEDVMATLRKIYHMSKRWICLGEYHSPARRQVKYHGHADALWLDDFAGRMMDEFHGLELIKVVFHYSRCVEHGGDITYFLLEKTK